MKIAIHRSSVGFSSDWINYCKKFDISYKVVNCYQSDIINQLEGCDILLWHHHHSNPKDVLFAKGLLYSLEQSGKSVFPEFNSGWHFDDKVGQKYLLESIDAPLAPTWIFYDKKEALEWIEKVTFPIVFKLRGGAGSANVKLIRSKGQSQKMIRKAFGKGFPAYDKWNDLREHYMHLKLGKSVWRNAAKSIRRAFVSTRFAKTVGNQKGYIYFQEFIPNNDSDIRIITIGEKAFAIKRMTRPNDFRASGGGNTKYERELIDERCIRIAFDTSQKLNAICVAYDFVFDKDQKPLIVEINYGFAKEVYYKCPGYWDQDLNWIEGNFNQVEWILEEYLKRKQNNDTNNEALSASARGI